MRTLHFIPNPDKRRRIAAETMDIYAPLAARIGVNDIKDELEDLAFAEINPDARSSIKARLDYLRSEGGDLVERLIEALRGNLSEGGDECQIPGRMKTPDSVCQARETTTAKTQN